MIIYKVTNKENGMCYIGKTKRSLEARWKQHIHDSRSGYKWDKFKLQKAITKYGVGCFVVEKIDVATDEDDANAKEAYWIQFYDSIENGYNTARGGKDGGCRKKVMCVETGEIFTSILEAGEAIGVSRSAIYPVVDKPNLRCGGFHWVSA